MCGIFAFLKNNSEISDNKLKECGLKCSHRGPDSTKDVSYDITNYKLYLMFHRLAINGLTEIGDQPLTLNNKILICNGEIYNYKKLAEQYELTLPEGCSDCEVILHLYQKIGIHETISNLDGVFSFILFDFNNNKLFVGHDPIGVRSLYYFTDNGFGFASEMKCLTDLSNNIKMFPPGTYLQYELYKDFEFVNYFKFDFPTINDSEETIMSNLKKLLSAVDKRLMSEKPIGCLLSGGFDSSLITALSVKNKKFKNFFYWIT